jgi:hypothetical protein
MALIAVAGVGLSHSASANADAKIYITNVASGLTDEVSPPSGGLATDNDRTTASTVYGTYEDDGVRNIVTRSDHFVVTVVDSTLNDIDQVYTHEVAAEGDPENGYDISDVTSLSGVILVNNVDDSAEGDADDLRDLGDQFRLVLTDDDAPIVGSVSDIKIVEEDSDTEVAGLTVSEIFAAGVGGASLGIITVNVTDDVAYTGKIRVKYPTSDVDESFAEIKSVVDGAAPLSRVTLTETGRNTGRFEGYIKVFKRGVVVDGAAVLVGADGTGVDYANAATVAAIGGPITVIYTDGDSVKHSTTADLDITVPTATITSPVSGSETQNRLPTFNGNVADNQSGIDVGSFGLFIDGQGSSDITVIAVDGTTVANTKVAVTTGGATDGATSMAFSHTPGTALPVDANGDSVANPDHLLDYQVRVADLAGNYGYSDSAPSSSGADADGVLQKYKSHSVRIDQVIPQMEDALTGTSYNTETSAEVPNTRDSIKVIFDGNVKSSSVSASDFKVTFSGSGGVFVPASVIVNGPNVYLDLDSTIPSDNTPTVALQGTVQDLAGNSTDAGSASASDGLKPVLTVTQSGGTGTGTGSEGPGKLTSGSMTITVASDEDLNGSPVVTVNCVDCMPDDGDEVVSTMAVPQGGNVWKLTVSGGSSGNRAVTVTAQDVATNASSFGNDSDTAFVVDSAAQEVSVEPDATTQANPYITVDYSTDLSTLSVTSATLDDVDVTSHVVASADKKKFFFQPTTALSNGSHEFVIKVVDAAGNEDTAEHTFTKSSRTDFVIELFAGWNAVSVPSNPLDDSIGSVFSNSGVKQVVAYDATTPAQPWRIASKVDGSFSSQTNPGLTSINTGHGYWVETTDFENQKVALEGPTGPGDARPGLTTIPTGNGWNFVGVVDQSRNQTQGGHENTALSRPNGGEVSFNSYLSTVNYGRVYTFDTVDSEFDVQDTAAQGGDIVKIGDGIWVYISPQQNGKLPHIVP